MGTALVTGATSGIGKELAWKLATEHHRVIIVARDASRLQALAHELEQIAGVDTEVIIADLSEVAGRRRVAERLAVGGPATTTFAHPVPATPAQPPVDLLVNNAGFGMGDDFLNSQLEREQAGLAVMVEAVLELTHAALPGMRERRRGAILNVASIATLTAQGTYSAHKAWVKAFTESIAAELEGSGVTATVLCPGLTRSEFHERQGVDPSRWASWTWTETAHVAEAALQAVRDGRVIITPNPLYKLTSAALRLAPRWLVRRVAGPNVSAHAGIVRAEASPGKSKAHSGKPGRPGTR